MAFTIYVGMALTEAPAEFREQFQKELKDGLRALSGVRLLDFVGLVADDAATVYRHDTTCAREANLCVFVCDYPSTGLGFEIRERHATRLAMMLFAEEGRRITRLITGFAEVENIPFARYRSTADIVAHVQEWLS
jgi:hypothetical protein